MSPSTQAVLRSWSIEAGPAFGLILSALLYWRGWRVLSHVSPGHFPGWRLGAFLGGLFALWLAVASPVEALSGLMLSAHMVQHLLLMSVAPPLLLLGTPFLPLLRGLPRTVAHDGLGPFLTWPALQRAGRFLTHPVTCWLALTVGLIAWHVPAAFELALRSPAWHQVEHATFFGGALLFWWPVIRPFPSRPPWPLWTVPLYLLAADLVNTALCAILAFSETLIYPTYASAPRLFGTTALSDQASAGVIMWVPGSVVFLVPATLVAIQFLSSGERLVRPVRRSLGNPPVTPVPRPARTMVPPRCFDLLRLPRIGRHLRTLPTRRLAQGFLLLLAVAVMVDGFWGPPASATNLAGVLPWTYARALVVVALLAVGNVFCFACPFMLPRELGRRLGLNTRAWPRALRSKWLAVGLLGLFFVNYEVFSLWDKPVMTAAIILGYFITAAVVDATFRGASFCKFVCPIGQFNFVTSLMSPLEVKVRQPDICADCRNHDCLRGNERQRGCELELFLPRKIGNLDCTFCLDCVRACPHDNLGVLAVVPGADLLRDPVRSSLGRLSRRTDLAALALLLVSAAFASAVAMTGPGMTVRDHMSNPLGMASPPLVATGLLFSILILMPAIGLGSALLLGRAISGIGTPFRDLFCRFSLALVPLGTAMWAGHLLFHLLAGYATAWPVLQRAAEEVGASWLGRPDWALSGWGVSAEALLMWQSLLLGVGLLATLYIGWRIALDCSPRRRTAVCLLLPWAPVPLLWYAVGLWIFVQPMQMRGLMGN